MNTFIHDLRDAVRSLRKAPAFSAIAIATLALGIGANAAMFSIVRGVLLRPLPYRDTNRLVTGRIFVPDYRDLRESSRTLDRMAIWVSNLCNLTVVLSHRLWRSRFASEAAVIGKTIELSGKLYTVIGVMPPGFEFPRSDFDPCAR